MSVFKRRRFPAEIILLCVLVCVRWYCRYGISYRDLEAHSQVNGLVASSQPLSWPQARQTHPASASPPGDQTSAGSVALTGLSG